ncbi:tyrosine-type recombinase/integrase [Undibacterium aquatile]|uniref:Tyrosine-type recombinase/integrase n=1 Tax=Undibacterium aquatile TaxID=1537398 RepID=A0ABR6XB02_9BURK|nr:tyrosine-type recombinase/integrase [Undibacterium aquatile]
MPKSRNVKSQKTYPIPVQDLQAVDQHERGRDFLSPAEVGRLLDAAKDGRYGERDYLLTLLLYRHGFRITELCKLRLTDLNLDAARIWIPRSKGSLSTEQPLAGEELRAIRRYIRNRPAPLPWLFVSERLTQLTRHAAYYLIRQAGERAGFDFIVHPHMLRHSCGFFLSNKGYDSRLIQDYLGHRDPRHTARYTRTAAARFEGLWER